VKERRRHPRHPVSWPARLWVTELEALDGRIVDASLTGMRMILDQPTSVPLEVGARYRLEITPEPDQTLACVAYLRHVSADGVGFENLEEIPRSVIWRADAR
jgi:hypothetical protein